LDARARVFERARHNCTKGLDCTFVPMVMFMNPHWADPEVRDILQKAKRATAESFNGVRVDVSQDAVHQWKIFAAPELLDEMTLGTQHPGNRSGAWDRLVALALRHVASRGRRKPKVTMDDVIMFSDSWQPGGYYPHIHWDTDWYGFPEMEGFQLWYLLENHWEAGLGNMFMLDSAAVKGHDNPVRFEIRGGRVMMLEHPSAGDVSTRPEYPQRSFGSLSEMGLRSVSYLDMKPGDCLVFSKRTLHMSDPRPYLQGHAVTRHAINARVVLRPEGRRTVNFWPDFIYAVPGPKANKKLMKMRKRVCGRSHTCMLHELGQAGPYHQLDVGRYELLQSA